MSLRVYGIAKTVADCFKYRNKIGLDVAIEALKDARGRHKISVDELWYLRQDLPGCQRHAPVSGGAGMKKNLTASIRARLLALTKAQSVDFN